jgi:hypothetical protein
MSAFDAVDDSSAGSEQVDLETLIFSSGAQVFRPSSGAGSRSAISAGTSQSCLAFRSGTGAAGKVCSAFPKKRPSGLPRQKNMMGRPKALILE